MIGYLLFFFVAMGAKLILAMITIYLLLPADRRCTRCDGETLPIRMRRPGRIASWLLRRRLEWRWCPRCSWEGMARGGDRPRKSRVGTRRDSPAPAPRRTPRT